MKIKLKLFLKDFSYMVMINIFSMSITLFLTIFMPKILTVTNYSYWQLFVFYQNYIGFFHLGWNDGIYLRYGGKKYDDLEKRTFNSQFWIQLSLEFLLSLFLIVYTMMFTQDINKEYIFIMIGVNLVLLNIRYMLIYVLQATSKIKEFAIITFVDRFIYLAVIILYLMLGSRSYHMMLVADTLGKIASLLLALIICRDFVFIKIKISYLDFKEIYANLNVGIKLLFSNIASMLVLGIVRLGIEKNWNVETFGKVSFTITISQLLITFINSIGIIIFPMLRNTSNDKLASIYKKINNFLKIILLALLVFYYPLKLFLINWLPNYSESINYMGILFPMCFYEGKMALLNNTYLKVLRKEKLILNINLLILLLSMFATYITAFAMRNLDAAIFTILFLIAIRCIISEWILSNELKLKERRDILLESFIVIIFIISNWFIGGWFGFSYYLITYILFVFLNRSFIYNMVNESKSLSKETF